MLNNNRYRKTNTSATPANRTDANLGEGVTDFLPLLGKNILQNSTWVFYMYRFSKLPT